MKKEDQVRITNELLDNLKKDMLEAVSKIPEEWDGLELRMLLEDKVKGFTYHGNDKRYKEFKNHVLVNNL